MASFQPLWDQRHLAIVHAAGSPDPTRSHFDAQDFMESGTPGLKATDDGWLNRTLQTPARRDDKSAFRAIALGPRCRAFSPAASRAVAVNNINDLRVGGRNPNATPHRQHLRSHVRPVGRQRVARHRPGDVRRGEDAEVGRPGEVHACARRELSRGRFGDSLQAARATHQGESRRAGRLRRHRRLGPPRQRRQHARPDRQRAARLLAIASPPSGPTSAISPKTRSSSPCPSSAAPRARTAIAAPTTATPT